MNFQSEIEIKDYVKNLTEDQLINELEQYQAVPSTAKRSTMESQLIDHLMEEFLTEPIYKDEKDAKPVELNGTEPNRGGGRALSAADQTSPRAYKRVCKLFEDLELNTLEEQVEFVTRAKTWKDSPKQSERKKKKDEEVLKYIQQNPHLLSQVTGLTSQS